MIRWLLRLATGLLIFVVLAVGTLLMLPAEKIAGLAADRFRAATGRELTISGRISPRFWPELGIATGPVTISNADWAGDAPMVAAEGIEIGVDARALWNREIVIRKVRLDRPVVRLERREDGIGNWEFGSGDGGEGGGVPEFTLALAEVRGGRIEWRDRASGTAVALTDAELSARLPKFRGAADIALSGKLDGKAFGLDLSVPDFGGALETLDTPLKLALTAGGSRIGFDGRAAAVPVMLAGDLDADLADVPAVFALAGMAAPGLPRGLGAKRIGVSGTLQMSDGLLALSGAKLALDDNRLSGSVEVALGGKPYVTAGLTGGALDLSGLVADGPSESASGWSTERIDASGLGAVDGEISLAADSVDLGVTKLESVRLTTRIEDARAVTDIRELAVYGGGMTGQVIVNARGGLSARVDVSGSSLSMQRLLGEILGFDRLVTTGEIALNVLGSGNSVAAIMGSLDGEGRMNLGAGELLGLDLVGMLKTLDLGHVGAGAKTIFDGVTATFTLEKGVLTNADLSMASPYLTATGRGRIGLAARTIDYVLTPKLREEVAGKAVSVPVTIKGSWDAPKFGIDFEGIAKAKLDEKADELKAKAEEEVRKKVAERLGVEAQEGEKVEDTLRRGVEEKARGELDKALGKALGGILGGGQVAPDASGGFSEAAGPQPCPEMLDETTVLPCLRPDGTLFDLN